MPIRWRSSATKVAGSIRHRPEGMAARKARAPGSLSDRSMALATGGLLPGVAGSRRNQQALWGSVATWRQQLRRAWVVCQSGCSEGMWPGWLPWKTARHCGQTLGPIGGTGQGNCQEKQGKQQGCRRQRSEVSRKMARCARGGTQRMRCTRRGAQPTTAADGVQLEGHRGHPKPAASHWPCCPGLWPLRPWSQHCRSKRPGAWSCGGCGESHLHQPQVLPGCCQQPRGLPCWTPLEDSTTWVPNCRWEGVR